MMSQEVFNARRTWGFAWNYFTNTRCIKLSNCYLIRSTTILARHLMWMTNFAILEFSLFIYRNSCVLRCSSLLFLLFPFIFCLSIFFSPFRFLSRGKIIVVVAFTRESLIQAYLSTKIFWGTLVTHFHVALRLFFIISRRAPFTFGKKSSPASLLHLERLW